MNELTINIARDFSRILGGREKDVSKHSGEEFREKFLDTNIDAYDRVTFELDGVLGFPVDFLDETFGKLARRVGKAAFTRKFRFVAQNDFIIEKIDYLVDTCGKP